MSQIIQISNFFRYQNPIKFNLKFITKIFVLLLFIPSVLFAQSTLSERNKTIEISEITFSFDEFSIIPNSLIIHLEDSTVVNSEKYLLNEIDANIKFTDSSFIGETILMNYQVYPVLLSKTYYHRKLNFIEPENNSDKYWNKKTSTKNTENFSLNKEGNISRTIMTGNSQDLSVLLNIDLRISGNLSDNLKIQAVISDNNLPFQEDGSSYKLQEFDKVYIRIFDKENELISGDITSKSNSRFLNFRKKSKGIIYNSSREKNNLLLKSSTSVSMSKGKYATNNFMGTEGNQGPYKLKGINGESYIVVLSGTEKIFMDGNLLKRGEENDYIINYNSSEIIFTNKNIITKDKRFYVEFEYNDRSYAQSTIFSNQEIKTEKVLFNFNFYSESDWKNQNYLTDLSDNDKKILSESGDNETQILSNSIDSVSYNNEIILYKKMDTTISGIPIIYYKFSNNQDSAYYQIKFTQVDQNNGDYILKEEGMNGRIFSWITPISIGGDLVSQGNFTPNIRIVSPKSKNIISAELKYNISEKINTTANFTFQNLDKNLFSDLDDSDNNSISTFFEFDWLILKNKKMQISSKNSVEYINEKYEGVIRYKEVEFNRKWNIPDIIGNQTLLNHQLLLLADENNFLEYQFQNLRIGDTYSGVKNIGKIKYLKSETELNINADFSDIQAENYKSSLLFYNSHLVKKWKYLDFDLTLNSEKQDNFDKAGILQENTFSFTEFSTEVMDKKEIVSLKHKMRSDTKEQKEYSNANQINVSYNLKENKNIKYYNDIIFRKLNFIPDSLSSENNLLSNNRLTLNLWNNLIQTNSNYEIGKGKEAKKVKSFIKVPTGMGTHNWIDNNNNGIQEINEFVIALFQDEADYVSLILPSSELENIYLLNYSQNININLKEISNHRFIKRLSISNIYQLQNKNKEVSYNPFSGNLMDSSINFMNQNINSLWYNRNNKKFSLLFSNKQSVVQNSFSYGTDKQEILENKIESNFSLFRKLQNNMSFTFGEKENISDFFSSKNYQYKYQNFSESVMINTNKKSSFSLDYSFKSKNVSEEEIDLTLHEIGVELDREISEKSNFKSHCKYINIEYSGSDNSILSYELMEGLSNGNNLVWGINYNNRLKNNLQINLQYSGRKSENSEIKHIGNMGITAYF